MDRGFIVVLIMMSTIIIVCLVGIGLQQYHESQIAIECIKTGKTWQKDTCK